MGDVSLHGSSIFIVQPSHLLLATASTAATKVVTIGLTQQGCFFVIFLHNIYPLSAGEKTLKGVPLTAFMIFVSEEHVIKSGAFKGNS